MESSSDDSDVFIEYQVKPVNKLTKSDGLKIKNRILRQTILAYQGYSSARKKEKVQKTPEKIQTVSSSSGNITDSGKKKGSSKDNTPKKTIKSYFNDSSPEKLVSPGDKSIGKISVRNDLTINLSITTASGSGRMQTLSSVSKTPVVDLEHPAKKRQSTVTSPKTINDYFITLSSSATPKKTPETPPTEKKSKSQLPVSSPLKRESDDDIEVVTLSPGIRHENKRFKSIADEKNSPKTSNTKKSNGEKAKRHLFAVPPFTEFSSIQSSSMSVSEPAQLPTRTPGTSMSAEEKSPEVVDPISSSVDANILDVIINNVIKHQLYLKENATAMGQNHDSLISDLETVAIEKYLCLDKNSQTLFMRMFFRKPGWHRVSSIKYGDLSPGLENEILVLKSLNLIRTDIENEKVRCQLGLLKAYELMRLTKGFNVGGIGSLRREELLEALLTDTRVQKSVLDMFKNNKKSSSRLELVAKETQKLLGPCFQLDPEVRKILSRVILLFSLPHEVDEEAKRATVTRFLMYQVLTKAVSFVPYEVIPHVIFQTRQDFLEYECALQLRQEIDAAFQTKNAYAAFADVGRRSRLTFNRLAADAGFRERVGQLPPHLRRYNAGGVHASILTYYCANFKKKSDTQEIITLLMELLAQSTFGVGSRGKWYELLCQAYQTCKMPQEAAEVIVQAAQDKFVDEVRTLSLQIKAQNLLKAKKNRIQNSDTRDALAKFAVTKIEEPTSIEINAQAVPGNMQGSKLVYVQHTSTGKRYSSVEEQAIYYYKSHGYTDGCHAEGFIVATIFYIFFFDLIYSTSMPGVFLSQYQERPLDMWSTSFFMNRRDGLDKRLREMTSWSMQDVTQRIEEAFTNYMGTTCVISWSENFSPKLLCEIIQCIGMEALTAICFRFVHKPRVARSGFPDLTLWNIQTQRCKFVEVKSPNDRLAPNQRVWLEFLRNAGIDCEVCNVRNTAAKMFR